MKGHVIRCGLRLYKNNAMEIWEPPWDTWGRVPRVMPRVEPLGDPVPNAGWAQKDFLKNS